MTNNCSNILEISGSPIEILRFIEGYRCNATGISINLDDLFEMNVVRLEFFTSEAPPEKWFNLMAEQFPQLEMELSYLTPVFAGCMEARAGIVEDNRYTEWNDYVDYVYGGDTMNGYGFNHVRTCHECLDEEVSITDIKKGKGVLCSSCLKQKVGAA